MMEHYIEFLTFTYDLLFNSTANEMDILFIFLTFYMGSGVFVHKVLTWGERSPLHNKNELARLLIGIVWVLFLPIGHILFLSLILYTIVSLTNDMISKANKQFKELRNER